MAKKETPATTQAEYDKAYEEVKSGKQPVPSFDDMGPLPKSKPKDVSSKKPEPTFKSDVDDIVSGVKKVDEKINDAFDPIRKVTAKAAGKTEKGILNTRTSKGYKSGGSVKSASARADGCAVRGKTRA